MDTPIKLEPNESRDGEGEDADPSADLSFVPRQWTPGRDRRAEMNVKKVRSAKDGPFMGGDWVMNEQGEGSTLSFLFLNPEGTECFGLTVGHLADAVGESMFRFSESNPIPVPDDNDKEEYFMYEVGTVTSISNDTDSLVFKVNIPIDECHPMRIALSDESHITLDQELLSLLETPEKNTILIGFGAQRRGAYCTVTDPSKSSSGPYSLQGDIGMNSGEAPFKPQTDDGDCGTIFFSVVKMAPLYFHHTLTNFYDGTKVSYGVPLLKILEAHDETRHLVPTLSVDQGSEHEPKKKKAKIMGSPPVDVRERASLHQFHTKVVDAPTRADSLKVSTIKDSSKEVARTVSTAPDYSGKEYQTLAVFNVRVVKHRTGSAAPGSGS